MGVLPSVAVTVMPEPSLLLPWACAVCTLYFIFSAEKEVVGPDDAKGSLTVGVFYQ